MMEVGEGAARALGAGFDLTSDFRLKFAKEGRKLVELDEAGARNVPVPGGAGGAAAMLRGVPRDVGVDKGDRIRSRSDVLEFNQDVICVKQSPSSTISSADLKLHLEDLGDFLFSDGKSLSPIHRKTRDGKNKVPDVFLRMVQQPNNLHLCSKARKINGQDNEPMKNE